MNVKILKVATDQLVGATINKESAKNLPSMQNNWRYNFNKHALMPHSTAYVLVSEETPDVIEGCMIFQMRKKELPFMAYLEVAPHNREIPKKYAHVAGCLIAYAYKQTYVLAGDKYKGYLLFDVLESNPKDEKKLMALYSTKYKAKALPGSSRMVIADEDGEELVLEYLKRA